jgi:putative alpha-1,2-mannosidase
LCKAFQLYGGRETFCRRLDEMFDMDSYMTHWRIDVTDLLGQYAHGNEPDEHCAYLYALAGAQYKTAWRTREILLTQYDNTPAGLCGNDDCGQISAWYVWSAIGLYPVNPAEGIHVIGSPLGRSASLGRHRALTEEQIRCLHHHRHLRPECSVSKRSNKEKALRRETAIRGFLMLSLSQFPNFWTRNRRPEPFRFAVALDFSFRPSRSAWYLAIACLSICSSGVFDSFRGPTFPASSDSQAFASRRTISDGGDN